LLEIHGRVEKPLAIHGQFLLFLSIFRALNRLMREAGRLDDYDGDIRVDRPANPWPVLTRKLNLFPDFGNPN
jgi:hypothetical protein